MGWREGSGLGRAGEGITEPVRLSSQLGGDKLGLGKGSEYDSQCANATKERRPLASEDMLTETDEQRTARELSDLLSRTKHAHA